MKTSKILTLPKIGRIGIVRESAGNGAARGFMDFNTNLTAQVIRGGQPLKAGKVMRRWARFWGNIDGDKALIDLGSGLVTNVGVLAMANEPFWANPGGTINTILGLANYHATGTGTTAAAATDFKLQTWDSIAAVAGAQSLVSSGTAPAYKTVATINYSGTEAVTEWGLHTNGTLSATTGSPFTATSANSGTATGTPYTASSSTVAGEQFFLLIPGTTAVWGLVLSNTTSVLTVSGWYNQSNGAAGSTPGSTEAFTLRPVMWDHKVFSALNVVNGDSIQFSYSLTINSGG